jgi:hypothetical protein
MNYESSLVSLLVGTAVSGDLGVNMATLALVQVDFHLDVVNFAGLLLELSLELLLELRHFALLFIVVVLENLFICVS